MLSRFEPIERPWYKLGKDTLTAFGISTAAGYFRDYYKSSKKNTKPTMPYYKRKRPRSRRIASRYFAKKRARYDRRIRRRAVFKSTRMRSFGQWQKRQTRKQKLKAIQRLTGVGDQTNKYVTETFGNDLVVTADTKRFEFGSIVLGLNTKQTYNAIYTDGSYTDNDSKFAVIGQHMRVCFKNQTDMGCYVKMHVVKLKKDWNSGFGSFESDLIGAGFNNINGAGASANQNLGVQLFMNNRFRQYFKVLNTRKASLSPGQTVNYYVRNRSPFIRSFRYRDESTVTQLKGSIFVLFEIEGVPIHDTTDATQVGTSAAYLDVVLTKSTTWRCINKFAESGTHTAGLGTIVAAEGLIDEGLAVDQIES